MNQELHKKLPEELPEHLSEDLPEELPEPSPAQATAPPPRFRPVKWIAQETPQDVELWIDEHNRSLQEHIGAQETGYGVCFTLSVGGNIYMQTSGDAVMLDVDADAQWVAPLITAATGIPAPAGQLWVLPEDKMIELIFGLSSLVASTTLVSGHRFGARHRTIAQ